MNQIPCFPREIDCGAVSETAGPYMAPGTPLHYFFLFFIGILIYNYLELPPVHHHVERREMQLFPHIPVLISQTDTPYDDICAT
jgi:hypothetical protein